MRQVVQTVVIGDYTFEEVTGHGFTSLPASLWRFQIEGKKGNNELYQDLDHALVSAVGEKHTGPRGAGGTGVGTAADWFMRMIGADREGK